MDPKVGMSLGFRGLGFGALSLRIYTLKVCQLIFQGLQQPPRGISSCRLGPQASQIFQAEALLQLPMDPDGDAASYDGTTPLMHAANTSQVDVVRLFIEAGAQLNYCSTRTGRTVLMQAAWLGYSEVVEVFLEAGARMDICDSDDRTALHISAEAAHASIVQLLLAAGADRDVQDHDGRTALMLATEGYHAEVRRLLEGHPVP